MIRVQPFDRLGRFDNDWLAARYHFSFAGYHDPERSGIGPLLVWNDDMIQPGRGFDLHGHRDMEIITYVREGAISHRDHLGNEGRTEAGDVQVMSAGTGIRHAEFNLEAAPTSLFQIWIAPRQKGVAPAWATARFPKAERAGRLVALASGRGESGALPIHQDATLYGATLRAGESVAHDFQYGRQGYLVAAAGRLRINGQKVAAREGVAITNETTIALDTLEDSELLLADLPAS